MFPRMQTEIMSSCYKDAVPCDDKGMKKLVNRQKQLAPLMQAIQEFYTQVYEKNSGDET